MFRQQAGHIDCSSLGKSGLRMDCLIRRAWIYLGVLMTVFGCCTRYKCATRNDLIVHNENGILMKDTDGVTLGNSPSVQPCAPTELCTFHLDGGDFVVTAPGYKSASFHVDHEEDDCGNSVSQSFEVNLVPENTAALSTARRTSGKSCGE